MNKVMSFIFFVAICMILKLHGATVDWPWLCFVEESRATYNALTSPRHELFVGMYVYSISDGLAVSFDEGLQQNSSMEHMAVIARAEIGDINNRDNLRSNFATYYYYSEEIFDGGASEPSDHPYWSDGPLPITRGESVYLAIGAWSFEAPNEILYGWAKLSVDMDGVLHLDNSAVARGGDAIVVGELAIPEPSCVLLLLVGFGLLALRRRNATGAIRGRVGG